MKIAVAGLLTAGAVSAFPATAAADPPPGDSGRSGGAAPAPNGIPRLSDLTSPLAQSGAAPPGLSGGLPANPFTANPDNAYFLAQNPIPEASGAAQSAPRRT